MICHVMSYYYVTQHITLYDGVVWYGIRSGGGDTGGALGASQLLHASLISL